MAMIGRYALNLTLVFLAAGLCRTADAAELSGKSEHVAVELISEHGALISGQSQQLGLLLRHEPHWHTYWLNPGDSGLPTTLAWTLPPGFKAQDITWPLPQRFDVGGLFNFGYEREVVLPIALSAPADASAGTTAHV